LPRDYCYLRHYAAMPFHCRRFAAPPATLILLITAPLMMLTSIFYYAVISP